MVSADTVPIRPKKGRIGSSKSKLGCLTCKIRRVKCDEHKPICRRCSSTGRRCEFQRASSVDIYSPARISLEQNRGALNINFTENLLSAPIARNQERRAFHFFFHKISPLLAGTLDADLWRGAVLQISRSQPAIWDAVNAISCLYEHPQFSDTPPVAPIIKRPITDPNHRLALSWYSRALSNIRNQLQKQHTLDPTVALLSCILFICIEFLQENVQEALQLYRQGLQLISNLSPVMISGSALWENRTLFLDTIAPVFYRLGTFSIFYGYGPPGEWPMPPPHGSPTYFQSLSDARNALHTLIVDVITFNRVSTQSSPRDAEMTESLRAKQAGLRLRLLEWHQAIVRLERRFRANWNATHYGTYSLLQMARANIFIVVETSLDQDETAYDRYLHLFKEIIEYAPSAIAATNGHDETRPPFTFELGASYPLFFAAEKCRDPKLRREALALLLQTPRVQGLHRVIPSAFIVANIIAIEEGISIREDERFAPPLKVDRLPDRSKRISDNVVFYPGQDRRAGLHMKFKRQIQDSQGTWHLVEEVVSIEDY